ncbi:uncharacterized protein METZ01_LOCUS490669 [marine metagenome]|uniref:Uncharacterized protein n=1 Tax=marine metagenome TaxID=408172 RepID=A0A383D0Q8_9ZZZZ
MQETVENRVLRYLIGDVSHLCQCRRTMSGQCFYTWRLSFATNKFAHKCGFQLRFPTT